MYVFEVQREYAPFLAMKERARELMRIFGMSYDSLRRRAQARRLSVSLRVEPGQICFIAGPSGSGKSTLLNALYEQVLEHERIRVEAIELEGDAALIDCVDGPLMEVLPVLTRAGLSDVPSLLQPPAMLSDGQKWRYRLARALLSDKRIIFADEFCAAVDDVTAMAVAYHLRKTADRTGCAFVLAGCREDVLGELRPEVIVTAGSHGVTVEEN